MMLRTSSVVATLLALSSVATSQQSFAPRFAGGDSQAEVNSAEPRVSASAKGVLLSWIERDGAHTTLKFKERTPAGWSAPKTVASGDDWFVNWADTPSVVRLSDGALVAHWLQKTGTASYDIRLARSTDDGKTWSASTTPHHDNTPTEHGFASMFAMPAGELGLVWLDGRAGAGHAGGHEAAGAPAMTLRFGTFDHAGKQTEEAGVDLRVCDCCNTAAAMTTDGPIVAFRDRSDKEIRDIAVSRLVGGKWTDPVAVHNDGWNITGCPVNGPALAARDRLVAVAWFSGAEKQNRAFVAFSKDAGKTFGAPIRLDDNSTLGRVDVVLLDDGSAVASWIEPRAGGAAQLRLRRIQASGDRSASVSVSSIGSDRAAGIPQLERNGSELVIAWTETSPAASGRGTTSRVQTAIRPITGF